MSCEKFNLPNGGVLIACSRSKPKTKHTADNALELWAIQGLAVLWRKQACTGADDGIAGSFVLQWGRTKKLSPRQWEAVVQVARKYTKQLGAEPDANQGSLL